MTRRSLWCFTWLLLTVSPWPPARGQTPDEGRANLPGMRESGDGLPCADTSAECARLLGYLAVAGSLEIRTLDRALAYQRRKL